MRLSVNRVMLTVSQALCSKIKTERIVSAPSKVSGFANVVKMIDRDQTADACQVETGDVTSHRLQIIAANKMINVESVNVSQCSALV